MSVPESAAPPPPRALTGTDCSPRGQRRRRARPPASRRPLWSPAEGPLEAPRSPCGGSLSHHQRSARPSTNTTLFKWPIPFISSRVTPPRARGGGSAVVPPPHPPPFLTRPRRVVNPAGALPRATLIQLSCDRRGSDGDASPCRLMTRISLSLGAARRPWEPKELRKGTSPAGLHCK